MTDISTNSFKLQQFQCDHCDKAFGQNETLQTHINATHTTAKRFCCDLCDYSSYHREEIERHNAVHLGKTYYKCDHCDKAYSQKVQLVGHVNTIHKNEFQCDQCDKAFARNETLQTHIKAIHTVYSCDFCFYSSNKRIDVERHSETVHLGKKDFRCDYCDKSFGRKTNLQAHINAIHKKVKRFCCDLCDYSSYNRNDMGRHSKTHLGKIDFRCDNVLSRKDELNKHSETVHLGKTTDFMCDICDKSFGLNANLQTHINSIHKKVKRFYCGLCEYSSYTRHGIKRHTKSHLGKKEYKCDHCDKAYAQKVNLVSHVNKIHFKQHSTDSSLSNYTSYAKTDLIMRHSPNYTRIHDVDALILMKEARKDQMFVSVEKYLPETYSDHKYVDQVNIEEILETTEMIEIKEEFIADPLGIDIDMNYIIPSHIKS
jgi:KRAB domain-containing zinc finger protein